MADWAWSRGVASNNG
uniref:Uncharacterized protein n=2 Tax=Amphimedon queenslandica TaxID=400682 RepID=A0A1X7TZW0_AMPQE